MSKQLLQYLVIATVGAATLAGLSMLFAQRLDFVLAELTIFGIFTCCSALWFYWQLRNLRRENQSALENLEQVVHSHQPDLPQEIHLSDQHSNVICQKIVRLLQERAESYHEVRQAQALAEAKAHQAENRRKQLDEIVSALNLPIIAFDQFDELILANKTAQDLLQLDNTEGPQETKIFEQLANCQELVSLLSEAAHRKAPVSKTIDLSLHDANGTPSFYRATCQSLVDLSQNNKTKTQSYEETMQGAVAVLYDIGEQKNIQKRNAEFVSAASHEMKTPLTSIRAYVELLADGVAEDEETREEFLEIIDSQADRLQRLINNLLDIARIEAGVVAVKKEPLSLSEVLEQAFHLVQPSAEQKSIEFKKDISSLYLSVLADRDMLLQATINLLSNAIKYTPKGGTISLRSRPLDSAVSIEVEDNGVGLSEEDCHKVFEKFYRVKENSNMATGTGLGLPLVKHIVEDVHRGTLNVQSEIGAGSCFTMNLPLLTGNDA